MKSLFFHFLLTGLSLSLYAQKPDCKLSHEGKFRIVDSLSGITIIVCTHVVCYPQIEDQHKQHEKTN